MARSTVQVALVEDDAFVIRLLEAALLERYDLRVYETGARAMRYLTAQPPDVILLDIGLPDVDGRNLLRELKRAPSTAKVPVIAVTGQDTAEDGRRLLADGFDAWIPKKVLDVDELILTIDAFTSD